MNGSHRKHWFYGWVVLLVTCFASLTAASITYAGSYIMTIMVLQEGLQEGVVGYATSLGYASVALMAVPFGKLILKFGNYPMMLAGLLLQAVTLAMLIIFPASRWMMSLSCFLSGFGTCTVVALGCPGIIKKWFKENIALPMSIVLSASSLGGFIMPPIVASAMDGTSWRYGWAILLGITVASAALLFFLVKEEPGEIGEVPDGHNWRRKHPETAEADKIVSSQTEKISLWKNKKLVLYGVSFMTLSALYSCIVSYISLYTIDRGFSAPQAAMVLSLVSLTGVAGKLFTTLLAKWSISGWKVTVLMFLVTGLGGAMLVFVHSFAGIVIAAILIGFGYNCGYGTQPGVLAEWLGDGLFSAAFGLFVCFIYIGCTIGPFCMTVSGWLGGGLGETFLMLSTVVLSAALLCFKVIPRI